MKNMQRISKEESKVIDAILSKLSKRGKRKLSLSILLQNWSRFVVHVERGYKDSIYEYANDLSIRDIIEELIGSVQPALRNKLLESIQPWDDRFIRATQEISRSLINLTTDKVSLWWFRIPKNLGGELEEDLRSEGLINQGEAKGFNP